MASTASWATLSADTPFSPIPLPPRMHPVVVSATKNISILYFYIKQKKFIGLS